MPSVLITGTSSGLGRGTAQRLHDLGWDVVGTVRNEEDRLALPWTTMRADVTSASELLSLGRFVENRLGKLDALVNNAGICLTGPWEELTAVEVANQLNVNVIGAMSLVRQVLPLLREARGVIVQISSDSGQIAEKMFGAYNASKFALEGASEALREEISPDGVRVVIVEPGNFRTEISNKSPQAKDKNVTQRYVSQWKKIDQWLSWHGKSSPELDKCVSAIVAAVSHEKVPFRLAVGDGVSDSIRNRATQLIAQMDASDIFLESL